MSSFDNIDRQQRLIRASDGSVSTEGQRDLLTTLGCIIQQGNPIAWSVMTPAQQMTKILNLRDVWNTISAMVETKV